MLSSTAQATFLRQGALPARPGAAATDFGEVCVLEPNNAEATKMLRRAQEEGHAPPPVVETCSHIDGESETSAVVVVSTTHKGSGAPLPPKTTSNTTATTITSCKMVHGEPGEEEASRDAEQNLVEVSCIPSPPSVPSFMVSGWLTSAEREQGGHPRENDGGSTINIHHGHLDGVVSRSRSKIDKSGDAQGAVSVSRLVSQLSAAQKAAVSQKGRESSSTSGTVAAAAQAEWSSMQLEEASRVQESLRRLSASSGGAHPVETNTKTVAAAKGKLVDMKRGDPGKVTKKKSARTPSNTKGAVRKTSDWWADLEEEESKVREAFRAKLGIGEKLPSTKNKKTEREKDKAKKKAASRLRSDVPP